MKHSPLLVALVSIGAAAVFVVGIVPEVHGAISSAQAPSAMWDSGSAAPSMDSSVTTSPADAGAPSVDSGAGAYDSSSLSTVDSSARSMDSGRSRLLGAADASAGYDSSVLSTDSSASYDSSVLSSDSSASYDSSTLSTDSSALHVMDSGVSGDVDLAPSADSAPAWDSGLLNLEPDASFGTFSRGAR
jgi:hypothetical protein